ncbi:MAG: helix-turn-helix transcriptional regulator [Cyanobacteriota bacterium]|jgi:AraC-like DNA-binding protein
MPDSFIRTTDGRSTNNNPFQRQMCLQEEIASNSPIFEAPLPLGSARDDSALLSAFPGVFHFAWPNMHIVAVEGAASVTHLARRNWISLLFIVSGVLSIDQQNISLSCSDGDCLFLPENPAFWQSSNYSVVCLMFSREQLTDSLKTMRYQDLDWQFSGEWDFSQPTLRKASDGDIEATLLSALHHLLNLTSELVMTHPILFTRLGISNQLSLLTALLASPELNQPLVCDNTKVKNGGVAEAIEELTSYMKDHLSQPLNLTILERYSHYSRRSLQYAFRQKFGCTITQWIRSQRLDQAHQRIMSSTGHETVTSIANACGYRSVSLFSIEFQKRFHVKPSVLLREYQCKID